MDERVLKWITVLTGFLSAVVCASLYFFPDIHEREVLAAEQLKEIGDGNLITTSANPAEVVEDVEDLEAQLKIALPKDLSEDDLKIENDYITQTVYIHFAGGVDDYFDEYAIKGSSDHIASLSYYKDGGDGVIALALDRVYELEQKYEAGSLYLNFINPHDMYDKVIVVDAGHGSRAPGAVKLGVAEKDIDLAILLELRKMLEDCPENIRVYYTRTSDTNPTFDQRVQLANKSDADLFISIHNNSDATGNFTRTSGTQVMYSESDKTELSSKKFAQICLDNVVDSLGSRDRGLLKGDSIYIIRTSEVPVALVEVGFMTNYDELEKLRDTKYQQKAAKGIYNAIMEAFQEGY
ncbi:MAG: N-acetylmuramoyl-L-alanine amidase [Agathobacter sp.]|nr:N-acetylmuramoyl-L-alanine amidase [Agathobacter sp.]